MGWHLRRNYTREAWLDGKAEKPTLPYSYYIPPLVIVPGHDAIFDCFLTQGEPPSPVPEPKDWVQMYYRHIYPCRYSSFRENLKNNWKADLPAIYSMQKEFSR